MITLAKLFLRYPVGNTIQVPIDSKECSLFLNDDKTTIKTSTYLSGTKDSLTVEEAFFKKVEDKYRYDLVYVNNKWILTKPYNSGCPYENNKPTKDNVNQNDKNIDKDILLDNAKENILIILESPHKDEYSEDGAFTPRSPANGKTGVHFFENFHERVIPILKSRKLKLDCKQIYRVFLVESVPYQTSLIKIHEIALTDKKQGKVATSIRDKVWNVLYLKYESTFKELVASYNPAIILNGCTSSDSKKKTVQTTLSKISYSQKPQIFKVPHPYKWGDFNQFQKVDL